MPLGSGSLSSRKSPRRQSGGATLTPRRTAILRRSNGAFTFISAREAFLSTLGLNVEQVVGHSIGEVFDPEGAPAIEATVARAMHEGRTARAADIECVAPEVVILDLVARPTRDGSEHCVELGLVTTAATVQALERLAGSLFRPTHPDSASALYVTDLGSETIRAFHNNLTPHLGLRNRYTAQQWIDIGHPDDNARNAEFLRKRGALSDLDRLTWDKRVRDVSGAWRLVSGRARILSRNPDGSPAKVVGVAFDSTGFHTVHDALIAASADLVRAEAREREHLGRELHDSTSQLLVGAQLTLRSVQSSESIAEGDRVKLREVGAAISAAMAEVRSFSFLLHPPDLKVLGLARALQGLCDGFGRRADLPIHFTVEGDVGRQQDAIEMALFRIAQEALMNVHRHAKAKRADVRLRRLRNGLQLEIADDGVGIADISGRWLPGAKAGVGIAGMHARMANLGGEVLIENRNPGLRVLARLRSAA